MCACVNNPNTFGFSRINIKPEFSSTTWNTNSQISLVTNFSQIHFSFISYRNYPNTSAKVKIRDSVLNTDMDFRQNHVQMIQNMLNNVNILLMLLILIFQSILLQKLSDFHKFLLFCVLFVLSFKPKKRKIRKLFSCDVWLIHHGTGSKMVELIHTRESSFIRSTIWSGRTSLSDKSW